MPHTWARRMLVGCPHKLSSDCLTSSFLTVGLLTYLLNSACRPLVQCEKFGGVIGKRGKISTTFLCLTYFTVNYPGCKCLLQPVTRSMLVEKNLHKHFCSKGSSSGLQIWYVLCTTCRQMYRFSHFFSPVYSPYPPVRAIVAVALRRERELELQKQFHFKFRPCWFTTLWSSMNAQTDQREIDHVIE